MLGGICKKCQKVRIRLYDGVCFRCRLNIEPEKKKVKEPVVEIEAISETAAPSTEELPMSETVIINEVEEVEEKKEKTKRKTSGTKRKITKKKKVE